MVICKADRIIGIDPDVNKSGIGVVSGEGREVEVLSLSFPQLLEYLQAERQRSMADNSSVIVVVEASWKISTNWHIHRGDSKGAIARKGKDAGRCHEVGRKIVECAQYYGLEVVEKLPLKKIWKGKDGKITHEEIKVFMPIQGRTNQEERDAALLAWDYAGLPIRMTRHGRV
ncbi:MAG: hypothetical protein IKU94_03475 [Bacteroidaceae bacterium]|nr:hypothetical protein [Bacteroidaceae bacterium]